MRLGAGDDQFCIFRQNRLSAAVKSCAEVSAAVCLLNDHLVIDKLIGTIQRQRPADIDGCAIDTIG